MAGFGSTSDALTVGKGCYSYEALLARLETTVGENRRDKVYLDRHDENHTRKELVGCLLRGRILESHILWNTQRRTELFKRI